MSTALAIPEMPVMDLGKVLADSGYFQDARQAAQAVVKVLAGRELGFGPIASMRNIKISKNGSIILAAELQASAVRKSGIYDYEVDKLDDMECIITFYCKSARTGQWKKLGESHFTQADMERAEAGKLVAPGASKSMAARFPRNMLFARAISNGVKWYCPDVTNGISVYTAEELGEVVDGETSEVIPVTDSGPKWPAEPLAPEPTETSGNGNGNGRAATESAKAPEPQNQKATEWPTNVLNQLVMHYRGGNIHEYKARLIKSAILKPDDKLAVITHWMDIYNIERTAGIEPDEAAARADADRQATKESA